MGRKIERQEDSKKSECISPYDVLIAGMVSVDAMTGTNQTYASTSSITPSRNLRDAREFCLNKTRASRCCMLYLRSSSRC